MRPALKAVLLAGTAAGGLYLGVAATQAQVGVAGAIPNVGGADVGGSPLAGGGAQSDAQLFLTADTVTYDSSASVVTAAGGVQIDYGDYKLVSRRVVYNQKTRRLIASGDVQLVQPDGNVVYADQVDITDDFRDGFVKALRIETPDNTRFAAGSAVRQDGDVTTFNQGVYTACEACREHPERAPLWQVKARKIVWDQTKKEIRYYGARFEFFGAPIAYLPYFQSPDPTVKRKSGFLTPGIRSSDDLGYGLRVPYFFAIAPDKDVTVAGTYYTKQGFLGEAEYRQAFENGAFTLQTAGIVQQNPDEFEGDNFFRGTDLQKSPDFANTDRGMVGTTGRFELSDRWTFGWSLLLQSDQDFSNTYDIENFDSLRKVSEIYLTGLGDQSYFDLRGEKFHYQSVNPDDEDRQPLVAPVFDYERIEQEPYLGGEVKLDVNVTSLTRDLDDVDGICATDAVFTDDAGRTFCSASGLSDGYLFDPNYTRYNGLEGRYARGTTNLEWRDQYTLESGLILRPTLALRGDLYTTDMSSDGFVNTVFETTRDVNGDGVLASTTFDQGRLGLDDTGARGMATAAIEARYPYLVETAHTSNVIEPIGQLIVRPNETSIGELPNEDAQSLVFNTGNLFSLDKFSGYDRIEGGTRANLGVRYSGVYYDNYSLDAVVGQSYQLAGVNSFDRRDTSLVGFDSGLEDDVSDYVASVYLGTPIGLGFGTQGRFAEDSLDVRRTDFYGSYANPLGSVVATYTEIAAQPRAASLVDRQQVSVSGTLNFAENWTAFGNATYDLENSAVIERGIGAGYRDECFSLLVSYADTTDRYTQENNSTTVKFEIGFRTISDFSQSFGLGS